MIGRVTYRGVVRGEHERIGLGRHTRAFLREEVHGPLRGQQQRVPVIRPTVPISKVYEYNYA